MTLPNVRSLLQLTGRAAVDLMAEDVLDVHLADYLVASDHISSAGWQRS